MISIPSDFATGILEREGEAGRTWLAALPQLVAELCQRWMLSIEGEPWHGHLAIVIPVLHHTGQCALKVTWRDPETLLEAHALKLWNGQDTVRVVESSPDDGALLLERLDAGRTLFDLPFEEAVVVAGRLVRNLAIPGDDTLPTAASFAAEFTRSGPERWERVGHSIPRHHLDHAVEIAAALSADVSSTMVNWDLHHGNVLFSPTREQWVVTDPKPAVGSPESGIAQLFWTRVTDIDDAAHFHRLLEALIDAADLEDELSRSWLRVRLVDFWLWELSVGLTHDPGGCATMLDWLGDH